MTKFQLTIATSTLFFAFFSACDPEDKLPEPDKVENKNGNDFDVDASTTDDAKNDLELCSKREDNRECTTEAGIRGIQFCTESKEADLLVWGPCLDPESFSCTPGETKECGLCSPEQELDGTCEFGSDPSQLCILHEGVPSWGCSVDDLENCSCNTPLVFSFDRAPIQIFPAPTATFDIDGIGGCITTDWPTPTTPWLALDVNKDGVIDSGRELFGSGTRLANAQRASNGFLALAELDSNHDGQINAMDERFSELVVWSDFNNDKYGTGEEMESLSMRKIVSIDLSYSIRRECDARGNCGVERSSFVYMNDAGTPTQGEVVDIHLACQ